MKKGKGEVCVWEKCEDGWTTAQRKGCTFGSAQRWLPYLNKRTFKFCPFCGSPIKVEVK